MSKAPLLHPIPFKHKVLFSEEKIGSRVQSLGKQISQDCLADPNLVNKPLILVSVLKGACIFTADLMRSLQIPLQLEFIGVSSYEGMKSSGEIKLTQDVPRDLEGQHILIVEDIIDSGKTIDHLVSHFIRKKAASVKVCCLLSKPEAHNMEHRLDYVGFEISKEFVVGYGLDLNGDYRQLPGIIQILETE